MFERSSSTSLVGISDSLATELFSRKKYKEAIQQTEITVSLAERPLPEAYKNIAACYGYMFEPMKSLENYLEYIRLSGSDTIFDIRKLSDLYCQAGLLDEAYDVVMNRQKESSEKHLDIGWHLFRKKRYEEAFRETDIGKRMGNILWIGKERYENLPRCPRWEGEDITDKRVCIIGECGLGDEFIFSRWLDLLPKSTEFHYYTNNTIADVIERNFKHCRRHKPSNLYDYWVPSMSLPLMLRSYDPSNEPYIVPDQAFVKKWKNILSGDKIAVISWTGSKEFSENHFRDIDVEYLISKIRDGYTIYSVCKEASTCPPGVIDLTDKITSWEDTLAILSLSDMVFCSCSSVSHAAGSMGTKTFVYTRPDDYFTWNATPSGSLSNWYSNVTVWRTRSIGRWKEVIDESLARV